MNDEAYSPLNQAFANAADNSDEFDFGFVQERLETCNLANFDFPPDEAAAMRERELARIAAELESEEAVYDEDDYDDDSFYIADFYIADRDEFEDDEDDYDRYSGSVGGDDDWDDELEDEDDYDDEE